MEFGGRSMSSVNSCKTSYKTGSALRHISNPMRGSSFKIITFIGLTSSREEKAFPITM
jgi:hypothetical protein